MEVGSESTKASSEMEEGSESIESQVTLNSHANMPATGRNPYILAESPLRPTTS